MIMMELTQIILKKYLKKNNINYPKNESKHKSKDYSINTITFTFNNNDDNENINNIEQICDKAHFNFKDFHNIKPKKGIILL